MVIGFIGLGNMASAIIGGIIGKGIVGPENIVGSDAYDVARASAQERFGIRIETSNKQVVDAADVVFLAVKPNIQPVVLEEIHDLVEGKLVISIAAGKSTQWISERLAEGTHVVRCMPNTPALVQAGCSAICRNKYATEEDLEVAKELIGSFGTVDVVSENLMDIIGGVSGAAPAYVFMFIEALADAGVKGGMPRQQAYRFAAQTVMGSAKLLLETGRHPGDLKDMVCSPGGTTIEGVEALEQHGFRAAIMAAIDAVMEKSNKL